MNANSTLQDLTRKKRELSEKRQELRDELSAVESQLKSLSETIELFKEDADEEQEGNEGHDMFLPDFPTDKSYPEQILYVLSETERIMQSSEMESYIQANSIGDVRKNAMAETMSRMARKDDPRLMRKKYSSSKFHYGLPKWWSASDSDFIDDVKPDKPEFYNMFEE
jgi:hypothetical protein